MPPFTPLYIDGENPPSGCTFEIINPSSKQVVGTAADATSEECKYAVEAAAKAFVAWEHMDLIAKQDIFLKAWALILTDKYKDKIVSSMMEEIGAEASWSGYHWYLCAQLLRYTATAVNRLGGDCYPSGTVPGAQVFIQRRAIGVILTMAPWNAPLYLAFRSILMALICGNTVVFRCSELSPRSQAVAAELFHEAGLPRGVLNVLSFSTKAAPSLTAELIAHPLVRKINFTGGDAVGRKLAQEAAKHLKPCILELSGKAPAIVLRDANIEQAAKGIVFGAMGNSGQICISTERIIAEREIYTSLKSRVAELCCNLKAGHNELYPSTYPMLPPVINEVSAERIIKLLQSAKAEGAEVIHGDLKRDGCVIQPHVFGEVNPEMRIWNEETFGPVIVMTVVDSIDEAVDLANSTDHSLTSSLWTNNVHTAMEVAARIRSGYVNINGATMHSEPSITPAGLGGISGYGNSVIEDFTNKRVLVLHPSHTQFPLVNGN